MTNFATLATIAAAGVAGIFVAGNQDEQDLYNAGLITVNPEDADASGNVKAVITDAGNAALTEHNSQNKPVGFSGGSAFGSVGGFGGGVASTATTAPATVATTATPVRASLSIGSAAKPKITRKSAASLFDFASLKAPAEMNGSYDAFFLADTEAKPASKVLKNAISNAKADFRTKTGEKPSALRPGTTENIYTYDREFTVYDNDGPNGEKGAWAARTK